MTSSEIKIKAQDGFILSATLKEPKKEPKGFIQINSGTGIPQSFYKHFANYLTDQGYVTITFDYRGIGGSKPKKLKGFHATNLQWGTHDMTSILDWGIKNYPDLRKIIIGHSMGGQLIGAMKNADKIDQSIMIASGTGYWKDMPLNALKLLMPILWYFYIPVTANICGYGAAKKIKQGENLPKGVAMQWRNWCVKDDYWESDFNEDLNKGSFSKLKGELKSISFNDDKIISQRANKKLLQYYSASHIEEQRISPSEVKLKSIGHFGFFSRKSSKLWHHALI
jgi:predicted alpha/beta hydrolase